ncbi:MAG: ketoacyl-ACP synthase III [Rhodobacter sp.]|uniref:beta-ketoacyl-ACP synthase III n=1 Tax=Pararhodobacter sp. TaxID=2127056 RepID=UPI002C4C06C6|nr:beta-ketoacyl-ACP synthase III [Pararhodobacter sp.]MCC0074058.1 ketoacyl-ACP synthase III [Rhodobacter sp.]HPD91840.1 beta-ketoacyl-ACP synthase III [Pararhodobacter sp.]
MTQNSVTRAVVIGTGHYLPARVVPNAAFAETLDTSDEWIVARSGIERRHFAAKDERTSDLAVEAARAALDKAGVDADTLDAIIVATSTPDYTFPSVATMVQAGIGANRAYAFDVQAVCAGFIYALANANALIVSGQARRVMVIGAETFSRIMDWTDRSTCVLFGDGAGALILDAQPGAGAPSDRGILSTDLNADGRHRELLYVDGGVSSTGTAGYLRMQGNQVFRHAVEKLAQTAETALEKAGLGAADVDWIVPHQANIRIIQGTARKLGLPMDKVIVTVQDHGNTSAASIPLALSVGADEGKLKPGDLLVTEAIGGGLAWGAVVLRW